MAKGMVALVFGEEELKEKMEKLKVLQPEAKLKSVKVGDNAYQIHAENIEKVWLKQ